MRLLPGRPHAQTSTITRAYGQFAAVLDDVELLIGYEGDAFTVSGDARADLLSITAVHPMRASAVMRCWPATTRTDVWQTRWSPSTC